MGQNTNLRTGSIRFVTFVLAALAALGMAIFYSVSPAHAATSTQQITVNQGSLNQSPGTCTGSQVTAQFVITQIDTEADAPASVHVVFSDGSSADFALTSFTGGTAHYVDTVPSGAHVTGATATIYSAWAGTFNLSDYGCGTGSTTTTTSSTTTSTTTTTTTTTTTVPGSTTTTDGTTTTIPGTTTSTIRQSPGGNTTTTTDGATTTLAPATTSKPATSSNQHLAFTGSNVGNLLWLAFGLITVGLLLTVRRRRADGLDDSED